MISHDRTALRQAYYEAWQAYQTQTPLKDLQPLQRQLVHIISLHPEYHYIFEDQNRYLDKDFTAMAGAANPFMHFSLHIAIEEQITTNRPAGICDIYQKLLLKTGDPHQADHHMMEVLADTMWQMLNQHAEMDEQYYLMRLQQLV